MSAFGSTPRVELCADAALHIADERLVVVRGEAASHPVVHADAGSDLGRVVAGTARQLDAERRDGIFEIRHSQRELIVPRAADHLEAQRAVGFR